jgi:hypothetical protein
MNKWGSVLATALLLGGCSMPTLEMPLGGGDAEVTAPLDQRFLTEGYIKKVVDEKVGIVCFIYVGVDMECLRLGEAYMKFDWRDEEK